VVSHYIWHIFVKPFVCSIDCLPVQVAHFLHDPASVNSAAHHLGSALRSYSWTTNSKLRQELLSIPPPLLHIILDASQESVHHVLRYWPSEFHLPILEGCFVGSRLHLKRQVCLDACSRVLAPLLPRFSHVLRNLDLCGNDITNAGAVRLAPHISHLTALTRLSLRDNLIGRIGAAALGPSLSALTELRDLDLSGNRITDGGLAALCPHLAGLPLQRCIAGSNRIHDPGAIALSQCLENFTALTLLDLSDNDIGDIGVLAMEQALQNLPALRELDVSGNSFSEHGAEALIKWSRQRCSMMVTGVQCDDVSRTCLRVNACAG
jgi:hypothetical protein